MDNPPDKLRIPAEEIARENDFLRHNLHRPHENSRAVLTAGVAHHPRIQEILGAVIRHDEFDPDDDPYGEHDFGVVEVAGESFYFKVDYYADASMDAGGDQRKRRDVFRVLTVMRADEY